MEKQLDIDEVIQLSHIDAIRDIPAFKREEIKAGDVGKLIEDHREKKNNRLFTTHGEEPGLYRFVLTRCRESK